MGVFEMVVAIVAVVVIGKLIKTKIEAKSGYYEDTYGDRKILPNSDAEELRDEVKYLKERVQVLEKIATDDRGGRGLANEIEKLRDR